MGLSSVFGLPTPGEATLPAAAPPDSAVVGAAVGVISGRVRLQAYTLSINDGFHLVAWACAVMLVLIVLLRKSPLNYGDLTAIQEQLNAPQGAKS